MNYWKKLVSVLALGIFLTGCGACEKGVEYLEQGEYALAEETFQKAIDKEQNAEEAYRGLGIAYWEEQEYEKCAEALKSALGYGGPETSAIYAMIANCEMELQNYEEAAKFYVLGIECEDADAELMQEMEFNLIAAYEKQGELELAKEKLSEYVVKYPEDEKAAKEALFLETR